MKNFLIALTLLLCSVSRAKQKSIPVFNMKRQLAQIDHKYEMIVSQRTSNIESTDLAEEIERLYHREQRPNKHRLGAEVPLLHIKNPDINVWTSKVYVGRNFTESYQVVIDTATDLVALNSVDCKSCKGPKLDYRDSDSFQINFEKQRFYYGSKMIEGINALGHICLADESTCALNFPFVLMQNQTVFPEQVAGVLGLARPQNLILAPDVSLERQFFFISEAEEFKKKEAEKEETEAESILRLNTNTTKEEPDSEQTK